MNNLVVKFENMLHDLIDTHLFHIGMAIALGISLIIRYHLAPITMLSADYAECLEPWVEYYRQNGIIKGLAETVGNYYVPYNLFLAIVAFLPGQPWAYIAGFSIICDYVSAFFVYLIGKVIVKDDSSKKNSAIIAAVVILLLPATIMNGALWKQCDSVYSCFLLISIYFAMKRKYNISLLMLGVSFMFKLQAIYLFPLFVFLYIFREKKLSVFHFIWVPVMFLIGGLPAVFAGRRILDVYDVYLHQASFGGYDAMTIGMPNLYSFGLTDYPALSMPAILITFCIFIFMACALQRYKKGLNNRNLCYLAIWCLWACVMFLPAQHERYNFPVLILLTAFYLVTDIKKSWTAFVINLISCFQYGNYLFKFPYPNESLLALFHMLAFLYVTYDLIISFKNEAVENEGSC